MVRYSNAFDKTVMSYVFAFSKHIFLLIVIPRQLWTPSWFILLFYFSKFPILKNYDVSIHRKNKQKSINSCFTMPITDYMTNDAQETHQRLSQDSTPLWLALTSKQTHNNAYNSWFWVIVGCMTGLCVRACIVCERAHYSTQIASYEPLVRH